MNHVASVRAVRLVASRTPICIDSPPNQTAAVCGMVLGVCFSQTKGGGPARPSCTLSLCVRLLGKTFMRLRYRHAHVFPEYSMICTEYSYLCRLCIHCVLSASLMYCLFFVLRVLVSSQRLRCAPSVVHVQLTNNNSGITAVFDVFFAFLLWMYE